MEHITAVDVSDVRLGLAEKVGADETFKELPADLKFDKVIDAAGQPITLNTRHRSHPGQWPPVCGEHL